MVTALYRTFRRLCLPGRASLSLFLAFTLLTVSVSGAFSQPVTDPSLLQIDYGPEAPEVVNVRLENVHQKPDGTIVAYIYVENLKAVVYDMTVEAQGNVYLDPLNLVGQDFFPLMARRTWPAEDGTVAVVFEPGSSLTINLDKLGRSTSDAAAILTLDAATMITLFSLGEFAPTVPSELVPGIRDELIGLLNNAGFDLALFTLELQEEDYWGALQQLGDVISDVPEVFADWIAEKFGLIVSPETVGRVGRWMRALPVLPVVWDLFAAPSHVDLTISAVSSSGEGNADVVLVLDRSGSMAGDKIVAARSAAKQFVNFMRVGDMVGVVSFSSYATVNYPLSFIDSGGTTVTAVEAAIDSIVATGNTSIGDGLRAALNQIVTRADPDHIHSIVLLSDGYENEPEYVASVLPDVIDAGIVVHTIGLGASVDTTLLQEIANSTGGEFLYAPSAEELSRVYDLLFSNTGGLATVAEAAGLVGQDEQVTQSITIDNSVSNPIFALSWPGSDLDLSLVSPSGEVIDPTMAAITEGLQYVEAPTYEFYRFNGGVDSGTWTARIDGVDTGGTLEPYGLLVRANTELRTEVYARTSFVQPGSSVELIAYVYDNTGGVDSAVITAAIQSPVGTTNTPFLPALDLGPGYHRAMFTDTLTTGVYEVHTTVNVSLNDSDAVSRTAFTTFLVADVVDPLANMWISIVGDTEKGVGGTASYTLIYGNNGPQRAENVMLAIYLPEGAVLQSSTLGQLMEIPGDNGFGVMIGSLEAHEVRDGTVNFRLPLDAVIGDVLDTSAAIYFGIEATTPQSEDPFPANNYATVRTYVTDWSLYLPVTHR